MAAHGNFYDTCILGSGNRAMFCAAVNRFDDAKDYLQMGESWTEHYMGWARSCYDAVRGEIGFIEGGVFHLWHGRLTERRYADRHVALKRFDFDPQHDIVVDEGGCWRWSSAKNEMHEYVRSYFESRREDD
jgi:hypothetical protein